LANIALHVLDEQWATMSHLGMLVRYADDLVVLCRTRQQAEKAHARVAAILAPLGLHLHPDKTRIVSLAQGRDGFDFLGFHHRLVKSWKWRGRYYLNRWPSTRAMGSIRTKVRERTDRRYASASMEVIVGSLNPVLRAGGTTSGMATPAGSSQPSTCTSINAWLGWPASNMGSAASTGAAGSTTGGSKPSASTGSPDALARGVRMPDDERCRRAVCGRTACTVR
jgi:hypothetical protein